MPAYQAPYQLTIKPTLGLYKYLIPAMVFWIFVLYLINHGASSNFQAEIIVNILWGAMMLNSVIKLLWVITGRVQINIDMDNMTVRRYFMGIATTNIYPLEKIKSLNIVLNEKTQTYLGYEFRFSDRVIGFTYKNPVRFTFTYYGTTKKIGNYCSEFPAEELKGEIDKRKGVEE